LISHHFSPKTGNRFSEMMLRADPRFRWLKSALNLKAGAFPYRKSHFALSAADPDRASPPIALAISDLVEFVELDHMPPAPCA
jgi:hypothetical protein